MFSYSYILYTILRTTRIIKLSFGIISYDTNISYFYVSYIFQKKGFFYLKTYHFKKEKDITALSLPIYFVPGKNFPSQTFSTKCTILSITVW